MKLNTVDFYDHSFLWHFSLNKHLHIHNLQYCVVAWSWFQSRMLLWRDVGWRKCKDAWCWVNCFIEEMLLFSGVWWWWWWWWSVTTTNVMSNIILFHYEGKSSKQRHLWWTAGHAILLGKTWCTLKVQYVRIGLLEFNGATHHQKNC